MSIQVGDEVRLPSGVGRSDSELRWCKAAGRDFFILTQRGTFANNCYDHGRLLAIQIQDGVFPEILDTIATDLDLTPDASEPFVQRLASAVFRQLSNDVFESASGEFRVAMDALASGYSDGHADPRYRNAQVRDAVVAIDVGNLASGFARRMEKPLAAEVSDNLFYAAKAAKNFWRRSTDPDPSSRVRSDREGTARAVRRLARPGRPGMGCTGFAAGGHLARDGRMLHGRTFDGAFFAWNDWPGLFLTDERQSNPSWLPYAAIGTAGLPYSGGITGLNAAGIGCSLHQMSTVNYKTGSRFGRWDIAPFVQQRILREAQSLDDAVDVVRSVNHYASWTILVSDAKLGRALRIEINGGADRVEALDRAETIVQTNHFLHSALEERHDFFGDAHFTPTFGKWLESRARVAKVEPMLKSAARAKAVDTDWAIDMLASHDDGAMGGDSRSFGRTVVKAYGISATVLRADPARGKGKDEVWFSVGDRRPGPHSSLAGFSIDFEYLTAAPVSDRPVRRTGTSSADRERAFAAYVEAFITLSRPRDRNGNYLGRDQTLAEYAATRTRAIGLLDQAVNASEDSGVFEIPSRYIRARLLHEAGEFDRAMQDWDALLDVWERQKTSSSAIRLHPYEAACVHVLAAATEAARGRDSGALLAEGESLMRKQIAEHFPGGGKPHKHLTDWIALIASLRTDPAGSELPEIHFVTVE